MAIFNSYVSIPKGIPDIILHKQNKTFFAKALQALSIGHVKNQGAVVSRASDHLFQSRQQRAVVNGGKIIQSDGKIMKHHEQSWETYGNMTNHGA